MIRTASAVTVTQRDERIARCLCCNRPTHAIHGDVAAGASNARYTVQWTVGATDHPVKIDLVIGDWSERGTADDRVLVSLALHPGSDGGFMFVDGSGRPSDVRTICRRAIPRAEIVGTPMADQAFALIDAIWRHEPRIERIA